MIRRGFHRSGTGEPRALSVAVAIVAKSLPKISRIISKGVSGTIDVEKVAMVSSAEISLVLPILAVAVAVASHGENARAACALERPWLPRGLSVKTLAG